MLFLTSVDGFNWFSSWSTSSNSIPFFTGIALTLPFGILCAAILKEKEVYFVHL
jgi:hypothetical protein